MFRKHLIVFVVLAGILPLVGVAVAGFPLTQLDRPETPQIQTPRQVNDEDLRFFTGKISSNNGKYVLDVESPKGPYLLDDQKSAKQYEGRHVRVIGVLETASNTIHVRRIEEAAGPALATFYDRSCPGLLLEQRGENGNLVRNTATLLRLRGSHWGQALRPGG